MGKTRLAYCSARITSKLDFLVMTISISWAAMVSKHFPPSTLPRFAPTWLSSEILIFWSCYELHRTSFLNHFNINVKCNKCWGNTLLLASKIMIFFCPATSYTERMCSTIIISMFNAASVGVTLF